jgi:hypothetical protein
LARSRGSATDGLGGIRAPFICDFRHDEDGDHSWDVEAARVVKPSLLGRHCRLPTGRKHADVVDGMRGTYAFTQDIIKPGDKIEMELHPLRSGKPGGACVTVTLADGRQLSVGKEALGGYAYTDALNKERAKKLGDKPAQ